ncbi:hypothetical protein M8C21_014935, partial [Ambrosia artemisiifolia]
AKRLCWMKSLTMYSHYNDKLRNGLLECFCNDMKNGIQLNLTTIGGMGLHNLLHHCTVIRRTEHSAILLNQLLLHFQAAVGQYGLKAEKHVAEGGIYVDQLFFHDPDGFMFEICNCNILPVVPIAGEMVRSCSRVHVPAVETAVT